MLRRGGSRCLRVRQDRKRSEEQHGNPDSHNFIREPQNYPLPLAPYPFEVYFAFGRCNERMVIGLLMSMN